MKIGRVLILEPHADGHHGPYLEWMVNGLANRGFEVTVVTLPDSLEHPSIKKLTAVTESACLVPPRVITLPVTSLHGENQEGTRSHVMREFRYWRLFKDWYEDQRNINRPSVVFLPYVDYCLYAIGLLGSPFGKCPWVGLAMRPSFHYRSMGVTAPDPALAGIKKSLFFRVLRNRYLKQLLTIDEPLATYLSNTPLVADKHLFFPEPAEFQELPDSSGAKRGFGISPERKMILLYGSVTARKGVTELLQALADPNFPPAVDVLVAGRIKEAAIRELMDEPWVLALRESGRLQIHDRFIDVTEEPTFFSAADIVWVGYKGHYSSSGVLAQAANAGRPVIACEQGVLGWQTHRHDLGRTVDPMDSAGVISAVRALLNTPRIQVGNSESSKSWRSVSFDEAQNMLSDVLGGERVCQ